MGVDSNFTRGYRHGLKAAVEMINRIKSCYENDQEVSRALTILASEIPRIGCSLAIKRGEEINNEAE